VSYITEKVPNNAENVASDDAFTLSIYSHVIRITYLRIILFLSMLTFYTVFSTLAISMFFVNYTGAILLINSVIWITFGLIMIIWGKIELK
jgi:hypothetical protein